MNILFLGRRVNSIKKSVDMDNLMGDFITFAVTLKFKSHG